VLEGGEWRKLLSSIPTETVGNPVEARADRHPHLFLRAHRRALKMKVWPRGWAWTIRLHEKGGTLHALLSCARGNAASYIAAIGIAGTTRVPPLQNLGYAQPSTAFCVGRFTKAANWSVGHGIVHSVKEGHYAISL
jgi:hypothetical protein